MCWTRLEKKGYRRKVIGVARTLLSANCVRILGIDNGQRDPRIAADIAVLLTAARRIKDYMLTIEVAPYRSDLRPSVGHQRAQTGECWLLEKVDVFFRNHVGHR